MMIKLWRLCFSDEGKLSSTDHAFFASTLRRDQIGYCSVVHFCLAGANRSFNLNVGTLGMTVEGW